MPAVTANAAIKKSALTALSSQLSKISGTRFGAVEYRQMGSGV
jgi:hypothetical protein